MPDRPVCHGHLFASDRNTTLISGDPTSSRSRVGPTKEERPKERRENESHKFCPKRKKQDFSGTPSFSDVSEQYPIRGLVTGGLVSL